MATMQKYDRQRAVRYANYWWNSYNPRFPQFDVDCTNFVSQCIHAGGIPMSFTGNIGSGWWCLKSGTEFKWSYSWSVAHSLRWYLSSAEGSRFAERVDNISQLEQGDVIIYDFDNDGVWQHTTFVTGRKPNGQPLVNAHTVNSYRRTWDYSSSYSYTPETKYMFFHIKDVFYL